MLYVLYNKEYKVVQYCDANLSEQIMNLLDFVRSTDKVTQLKKALEFIEVMPTDHPQTRWQELMPMYDSPNDVANAFKVAYPQYYYATAIKILDLIATGVVKSVAHFYNLTDRTAFTFLLDLDTNTLEVYQYIRTPVKSYHETCDLYALGVPPNRFSSLASTQTDAPLKPLTLIMAWSLTTPPSLIEFMIHIV
jgi:hypothetical protein